MSTYTQTEVEKLLDFIGNTETGVAAPHAYRVVYGRNEHKLKREITDMTCGEVVEAQRRWTRSYGSSACGRYQFIRATLKGLLSQFEISRDVKFSPRLQDELAWRLLQRRGLDKWLAGNMTDVEFAKQLAMEWASLPVLQRTAGAHRTIERGQSYYAGDSLNKSLVPPEEVERVLSEAKAPIPVGRPPREPSQKRGMGIIVGIIALASAAFAYISGWFGG